MVKVKICFQVFFFAYSLNQFSKEISCFDFLWNTVTYFVYYLLWYWALFQRLSLFQSLFVKKIYWFGLLRIPFFQQYIYIIIFSLVLNMSWHWMFHSQLTVLWNCTQFIWLFIDLKFFMEKWNHLQHFRQFH